MLEHDKGGARAANAPEIQAVKARASAAATAGGNYATITAATPPNTSAAPAGYIVAAIVVKPKVSGIFRIDLDYCFFDTTAGEDVTTALEANEAAAPGTPITITGGTNAGFEGNAADATTLAEIPAAAGTGLTIGGSAAATHALSSRQQNSVAGANQQQAFGVHGIFCIAGGANKDPATLNEDIVFWLKVTAPAGTLENQTLNFSVQELAQA
jgi:ribosomal protein L14